MEQEIRNLSIAWNNEHKRSAHNPYHPRNGSVAKLIHNYMKFMKWYRVLDVKKWSTRRKDIQMVARYTIQHLEIIYSDRHKAYHAFYDYPEEEEMKDYDSLMDWVDNALFSDYEDSNALHSDLWDSMGVNPLTMPTIMFADLEQQREKYIGLHVISLAKADRDYIKMMKDD